MSIIATIATALWAMLPAYVPNNAAVLAGGGRPVDGGRSWGSRRILGDGKTWRGTIVGTLAGVAMALILTEIQPPLGNAISISLPSIPLLAGVGLALGAMVGDMGASFLKRRSGRDRGAAFPVLDQLDFVAGALVLALVLAPDWFLATFTLPVLAVVLVLTPILHIVTNAIAYLLGLKDEPW